MRFLPLARIFTVLQGFSRFHFMPTIMQTPRVGLIARLAASAIVLSALHSGTSAFAQTRAGATEAIERLRSMTGGELNVTTSERTGLATFVSASGGRFIAAEGANAAERARTFLASYGSAFGVRAEDTELIRVHTDALNQEHVRLRQLISGIPVTGGELIVHMNRRGVVAANGRTLDNSQPLDLSAFVTPQRAREVALASLGRTAVPATLTTSEPRLEILNQPLLGGRNFPTRLAWFVEVTGDAVRQFVWVDAQSAVRLLSFSQLTHGKDRKIYDANSANERGIPVGTSTAADLIRSEGETATPPLATLPDALNAYIFSGDTYDYFFAQHGRDSFDNAGGTIHSTIRHCAPGDPCPYGNAFWDGQQMVYGEDFASADDVVGHEITHAVTERTANLFYYMQSGALNESYSDIFGETIDLTNAGSESPSVRWQIGEELGAFRNMMTPTAHNDPGKMSDSQFRCDADPFVQDAGGVHKNSGVPNHAYALMVDGGTYNGFTVTGIGLTKAAKIQYRALTTYLTSAGDFLDNYNAVKQACADLVGTAGITATNCTEVGEALDAVQMNATWNCPGAISSAPLAYCSAGQARETSISRLVA
jgi:bacillolysin